MNRYNNDNNKKEDGGRRENEGQKGAAEQPKGTHQGNRDNEKREDWKPGMNTGNDENEGGVRPE